MKYLVPALLIAMSSFFGFSAQAEDGEKEKPRYFIADQIFTFDQDSYEYSMRRYWGYDRDRSNWQATIWYKISANAGTTILPMPNVRDYGPASCFYDLPLQVLQDIRTGLGAANSYQNIWIENQNRVFSACRPANYSNADGPPVEPKGPDLPARAKSDFLYQLASWNFYAHDYEAAQKFYEHVATDTAAPMRPYANYMLLRTLRESGDETKAYKKINSLLADPTLKLAFPLIENYRFILGWESSGPDPKAHLEWLLSVIKSSPEKATDLDLAYSNYSDAMQQLNAYFPTSDDWVDWWLTDTPQGAGRMEAVRAVASQSEITDWMQALWAYNWFDNSWLWALHRPDNDYWTQNKNIVNHAWRRWGKGDGMEWLEIAARRIHPKDPLATDILAAISPYLTTEIPPKIAQHKAWLLDLWAQSIRIHLGRDEFNEALSLVKDHPEFTRYNGVIRPMGRERSAPLVANHAEVLSNAIRWLIYVGHYNEARSMLTEALVLHPTDYRYLRTLLGEDWSEIIKLNTMQSSLYGATDNYVRELWQAIVNTLSTEEIKNLADNEKMSGDDRAYFSRAALTRAFLLNKNSQTIRAYVRMTADLNPTLRDPLLKSFETAGRDSFISFLVRNPRFRPLPYIYLVNSRNRDGKSVSWDFPKIDSANPMDNNWWCPVNGKALDDAVFEAARILPTEKYGNQFDANDPEFKPYLDKQREFLSHHPYRTKVDEAETKKLEAIGSGPQYLSETVIAHADSWRMTFFQTEAERQQNASDLALAVRTTHYGCGRYQGGQPYSRKAYKLLHDRYPDSIWAEATPYWY